MKKGLKNTLALGVVVSAVALSGISVLGADAISQRGDRMMNFSGADGETGMKRGGPGAFGVEGDGNGMQMKARINDFSWAVEQGIISQETADKITAYTVDAFEAAKTKMDELKNLTPEERKEFAGTKTKERKHMFEELVSAGILTQAEADALKDSMPKYGFDTVKGERGFAFGGMNLETLIEKGIISQAEADSIKAYMEQKSEKMKAEMESRREEMEAQMDGIANMTVEERREFFESVKDSHGTLGIKAPSDILDEMVDENVITQSQADAIRELMPQRNFNADHPAPDFNIETAKSSLF